MPAADPGGLHVNGVTYTGNTAAFPSAMEPEAGTEF